MYEYSIRGLILEYIAMISYPRGLRKISRASRDRKNWDSIGENEHLGRVERARQKEGEGEVRSC